MAAAPPPPAVVPPPPAAQNQTMASDPPAAKPAQAPVPAPASTPTPTPTPAPVPVPVPVPAAATGEKRKRTSEDFRNFPYFKLRSVVKDMRPLFVELLQAPDFCKSNVAQNIRNQMKLMMELSRELTDHMSSSAKSNKPLEDKYSVKMQKVQVPETHEKNELHEAKPRSDDFTDTSGSKSEKAAQPGSEKAVQAETIPDISDSSKERLQEVKAMEEEVAKKLDDGLKGTYVVGGSKLGWNFLVYPGGKQIYYGVTKESKVAKREST